MQKEMLMTLKEAAYYLGVKKSYLYKMTMNHEIPFYKPVSKLCLFKREDLDSWLDERVRVGSRWKFKCDIQETNYF